MTRLEALESNLKIAYAVAWGQCSMLMRTKGKASTNFAEHNGVWLLKAIKGVMLQFKGQQDLFLSLDDAVEKLYSYRQRPEKSVEVFRDEYILLIDVVERYGGTFSPHPTLITIAEGSDKAEKLE